MTAELKELEVVEISLVDAPANPEAQVLIYKAFELVACPECESKTPAGTKECPKCGASMAPKKKAATPPQGAAMTEAEIKKLEGDLKAATDRATAAETKLAAAEKKVTDLTAEVAKRQTPEEIEKAALAAIPEPFRKRLEAAEAEIKKQQDAAETTVYVAKARELKHLPVKAEEFGLVLKAAAAGLTPEQRTELDRVLKAADEALRAGFREIGKGGTPDASDPSVAFTAKVAELTKGGMKVAEAISKAAKEDPSGYAAYREANTVRA